MLIILLFNLIVRNFRMLNIIYYLDVRDIKKYTKEKTFHLWPILYKSINIKKNCTIIKLYFKTLWLNWTYKYSKIIWQNSLFSENYDKVFFRKKKFFVQVVLRWNKLQSKYLRSLWKNFTSRTVILSNVDDSNLLAMNTFKFS